MSLFSIAISHPFKINYFKKVMQMIAFLFKIFKKCACIRVLHGFRFKTETFFSLFLPFL